MLTKLKVEEFYICVTVPRGFGGVTNVRLREGLILKIIINPFEFVGSCPIN